MTTTSTHLREMTVVTAQPSPPPPARWLSWSRPRASRASVATAVNGEFVPERRRGETPPRRRRPHRDPVRPPGRLNTHDTMNQNQPLRPLSRPAVPSLLTVYGEQVASRLLLGTALYPSPQVMSDVVQPPAPASSPSRVSRAGPRPHRARFLDLIRASVHLLPNTAAAARPGSRHDRRDGARAAGHRLIKLEVIANDDTLQLTSRPRRGRDRARQTRLQVFPGDRGPSIAERLTAAGCRVLMPWARRSAPGAVSPIRTLLRTLRLLSRHAARHRRRHRRPFARGRRHGDGLRRRCSTPPSPRPRT